MRPSNARPRPRSARPPPPPPPPLLGEPLSGPVYLKSSDNQLPDLAADLNGIIDVDVFGRIDQDHGRIRNTFDVVPDAPVSHFSLQIEGGPDGVLVNANAG